MKGFQKRFLRGLAHKEQPVVMIGQKGITDTLIRALDGELERRELVKIRFSGIEERDRKRLMAEAIGEKTSSTLAGLVGHTAIFYRRHRDPQKRKIVLPERDS
jgi:RNA-binding protein